MAQHSWETVIARLSSFPSGKVVLNSASEWNESHEEALVTLTFLAGTVFESCQVQVTIAVGAHCSRMYGNMLRECDDIEEGCDTLDLANGIGEAISDANSAIESSGINGPLSVRSAILRLCDALCIELSTTESQALMELSDSCNADDGATSLVLAPSPPVYIRECSVATTQYSFESDELHDDSEENIPSSELPAKTKTKCGADFAPTTEDVVQWSGIVDCLKNFPGNSHEPLLILRSAGSWDGKEGLLVIELCSRDESFEWESLEIVLIAGVKQTCVKLKGAQVIPETVRHCVDIANSDSAWGTGPSSVGSALVALCAALGIQSSDVEQKALEKLGDRTSSAALTKPRETDWSVGGEDLALELKAVEVLKTQLGLIQYQIQHIKQRMETGTNESLQHELQRLRVSEAEVTAEKNAAGAAVEAVMRQCTATTGSTGVKVEVRIDDRPSQSIRAHGTDAAKRMIAQSLAHSGPWAHYAAHQFSLMLAREQDLYDDYLCLYHSYSQSSLLYEVYAEIARHIYGLPTELAPVPRISKSDAGICLTLDALKALGGRDGDKSFQALGLSASCSIFASGSEAPPLSCFQGGYSASNPVFRNLLKANLARCGISDEVTIRAVEEVAQECSRAGAHLTGYMLQIFIHKSICKDYVYPSLPYGVPIAGGILDYVFQSKKGADGQARILFDPEIFLNSPNVKLFHYCARPLQSCMDADVPGSRGAVIRKLHGILGPMLSKVAPSVLAERFNGTNQQANQGKEKGKGYRK